MEAISYGKHMAIIELFISVSVEEGRQTIWRKGYEWFCGYSNAGSSEKLTLEEKKQRVLKITSIEQDPRAIILLRSLLVIILSIGIFIYVYFSI